MEFIYGYVKGICGFTLILTLILNLFPDSSNKKYLKLFAGLLLLSLVMQPIFKITSSKWDIEKIISDYDAGSDKISLEKNVGELETKMFERVINEYQKNSGN